MFFGLLMVGKKNTWERDGATVTLPQMVVGALVAAVVVISGLIALVHFVSR